MHTGPVLKKRSNDHERKSRVYFTFYNKTELHYKVKVIFVYFTLFSIDIKIKRPRVRRTTIERIDRTKERNKTDTRATTCNPSEQNFDNLLNLLLSLECSSPPR